MSRDFKIGLFSRSKSSEVVKATIAYFKLTDWWLSEFSEIERNHIVKTYSPMGGSDKSLVIAVRILKKAEGRIGDSAKILDLVFFYQQKIETYYKLRDTDPDALKIAMVACKQQIELAPQAIKVFKKQSSDGFMPSHTGFKKLMIIEEKNKNYTRVIELAQEAKSQGWRGDWDKRIERPKKKIG